jgi:hypothetical protein
VLPVPDVLGQRPPRLGNQVNLLRARSVTHPHPPTLLRLKRPAYHPSGRGDKPRIRDQQNQTGATGRRKTRMPQLAWLTDDMLNPSTRSDGIAARLK